MATTPSARAMLPTTLLRNFAIHSSHTQLEPASARHPLRKFAAQTIRYHSACAQTQEGNGANKKQPKKSAALSSAFERAAAYKKSPGKEIPSSNPPEGLFEGSSASTSSTANVKPDEGKPSPSSEGVDANVQESVSLQDVAPGFNSLKSRQESEMESALAAKAEMRSDQMDSFQGVEVEIITRDGIIRRKVARPGEAFSKTKVTKRSAVSSLDFIGLDFSEKKSSGKGARPAGLAVGLESPPPGSLPKVEIITRDGKVQQDSQDGLYKPKVVTWGVFERPANISETSELHGMAALQWAVSMDSSNRFQEARAMYEKIASHPNVIVRKKAKQLLYGFKAMDKLKVAASSNWDASLYRKYFDAFSDGYNNMLYMPSEDDTDDGSVRPQDFVYIGLLLFPLVLFLLVVALKGR